MTEHTCRSCLKSTTTPGFVGHYKLGLRNCSTLPVYRFVPGHHTCTNWSARTTEQAKEGL